MLVTKNAAELGVLSVNELYGQLPSRIFSMLLARGRSNVAHLARHTSLNQRQVRHGLSVLIQQNLVYYLTDQDTAITYYEANPDAAYGLLRAGKILDMVENQYGNPAKQVVHLVLMLGRVTISELVKSWVGSQKSRHNVVNGDAHANHNPVNGDVMDVCDDEPASDEDAYNLVAQLIVAGILEPVLAQMLQSPQELRGIVEQEILHNYPQGVRGSKQTAEYEAQVASRLRDVHDERTLLRRQLELDFIQQPHVGSKRRKLTNGSRANGFIGSVTSSLLPEQHQLTVIRLNYDKCLVELRNQKLAEQAADLVGETTAQVYAALLAALTKKLSRCQIDHLLLTNDGEADGLTATSVTTLEVFDHLDPSVDVSYGIGTASDDTIDVPHAERIRRFPHKLGKHPLDEVDHAMASDDDDYDRSGEFGIGSAMNGLNGRSNRTNPNDANGVSDRARRLQQMRQHLLLLADSREHFLRHCGGRNQGEWTVDFETLLPGLRIVELDTIIEQRFGRHGLRLTRILREKGKLDDKTLPNMALMRKADVHVKMAEMEMAGFLDVQEVPRDNNRAAARTIFFWFFDEDKILQRILDNTYKSMIRCLQRLEVERRKKKTVLSVVERKDVQGMEEEKLRGDVYNEYTQFVEIEKKLLGQVARLDDLVAMFRDY